MALRKLSKLEENTEQWFYEIKKVTVYKRRKLEIVIIGKKSQTGTRELKNTVNEIKMQ